MANPFDEFDEQSNPFDQFDGQKVTAAEKPKTTTSRTPVRFAGIKDVDVTAGKRFEDWAKSGWNLKRDAGLVARAGLNAVAALPNMAADFGVAARNLVTGSDYPLQSQMWSQGLTDMGLPEPQGLREKASSIGLEIAMGGKLPAPQAKVQAPANFTPQSTVRANTLREAQKEGLVVPPSSANPSTMNRLLESIGGKVATQQDASLSNQAVANMLANRSLGRPEGAMLTEEALQAVRNSAYSQAYAPVRGLGSIRLDAQFSKELDDVTSTIDKVAKQYPKLANTRLSDMIQSLKTETVNSIDNSRSYGAVNSDTAVDTIAMLRERAKDSFRQGDSEAGKAYRAVAKAFEDAIERSLERGGKEAKKILESFREGRKLIAKTHSVEDALNEGTGNVSIRKLAQQLAKGKPLSGELETLARFGQAFPKAAQEITDSPVNHLDVLLSGGVAGLTGHPAALAYPFTRQGARALLLSPTGQRLATPSLLESSPRAATSILYGTRGLLGQ